MATHTVAEDARPGNAGLPKGSPLSVGQKTVPAELVKATFSAAPGAEKVQATPEGVIEG